MGVYIKDNKLVIITEPKTIYYELSKDVDNNLKHEIEHGIKTKLINYCRNIRMETIFMNTGNSQRSESHKFIIKFSQRLDLRSSNRHVALQILSIHVGKYKTIVRKQ